MLNKQCTFRKNMIFQQYIFLIVCVWKEKEMRVKQCVHGDYVMTKNVFWIKCESLSLLYSLLSILSDQAVCTLCHMSWTHREL